MCLRSNRIPSSEFFASTKAPAGGAFASSDSARTRNTIMPAKQPTRGARSEAAIRPAASTPCVLRDALPAFAESALQDEVNLILASKTYPHPEEAAKAAV